MKRSRFKHYIVLFTIGILLLPSSPVSGQRFYSKLKEYSDNLPKDFNKIPGERKQILEEIGDYIFQSISDNKSAKLLFICTQNSRRSQFAQVWAQTATYYYRLNNIQTYSGGYTETAINYRILEALRKSGFSVTAAEGYSKNPVYLLNFGQSYPDIFIFSKKYDFWQNPNENYAAILCSKDLVEMKLEPAGSENVFALPYQDIHIYDNSTGNILKNDEICRQVASEMFYMMDYVSKTKKQSKKRKKKSKE